MTTTLTETPRRGAQPFLFSYDISCDRRRRKVLNCLRRWRVDGQLSVHETLMRPVQIRELSSELLDLVDRRTDRLFSCRLNRRGDGPVYRLTNRATATSLLGGGYKPQPLPKNLHKGWYLLAYDITDPKRLRRIQRVTAAKALFLQRSVYLFKGTGKRLHDLIAEARPLLDIDLDDLRVYALSGPADLWFLSGPMPPLPGMNPAAKGVGLWRRLWTWLGR